LGLNNPIEHGHAERGWIMFHVPKKISDSVLLTNGALECRDYLEHRYFTTFTTPLQQEPGPQPHHPEPPL
jgi:hypothetical protein